MEASPDAGLEPGFRAQADGRCGRDGRDPPRPHNRGRRRDALEQELAQKEGIFVGITAGATFAGAIEVCRGAPKGATLLCMLPDTGERYLSTPMFGDIPVDMTDEEVRISHSTPSYHMKGAA